MCSCLVRVLSCLHSILVGSLLTSVEQNKTYFESYVCFPKHGVYLPVIEMWDLCFVNILD